METVVEMDVPHIKLIMVTETGHC